MDGNDVEDQKCDSVVISPGETVDIKLTAKRRPNNYYINFQTIPTKTLWVLFLKHMNILIERYFSFKSYSK